MKNSAVCLNMIVKNEADVIQRCLHSVKDLIDYWVIVDTGSTDATRSIIQETLQGIPGELHERCWVNFEHNRNEALALAKERGEYILLLDADETLEFQGKREWPILDKDFYLYICRYGDTDSMRIALIKSKIDWKWVGVIHEKLECSEAKTHEFLHGVINRSTREGNRSKDLKQKFLNDAEVLQKAVQENPDNARYVFHLAVSYESAEMSELALKFFSQRTEMLPNDLEVYFSYLSIARIQEKKLQSPMETFVANYLKAHELQPHRAEPLYYLACYFSQIQCYLIAYLITQLAMSQVQIRLNEMFFIQREVYEYKLPALFAQCLIHVGKYSEACQVMDRLLTLPNLPSKMRDHLNQMLA